ncbi:MAG: ROK family protein [Candidatus Latescibacterota bacterium]|nr:MAG: ROK family protein [Candidatus Latescibacterota bacterium]
MKRPVYLGIDIGGTNMEVAVVGAKGHVLARDAIATRAKKGPEAAIARLASCVAHLHEPRWQLGGAGLGCAGLVDAGRGVLGSSPNLPGWENTALARIARRHFGVYTLVDNDANAAGYGEYSRGAGRGSRVFVCVTLGTGVGGSIIVDGHILRGQKNTAGEIGHMTIRETGPVCKCGNRGCLEAYLGADALVRSARRLLASKKSSVLKKWMRERTQPLSPQLIAEAAKAGDRAAHMVFEEAGAHLGTAMASLINVLSPDVIAVAGRVAAAFPLMEPSVRDTIEQRAFAEPASLVTIVPAKLGTDAAVIGMAMMVRERAAGDRSD